MNATKGLHRSLHVVGAVAVVVVLVGLLGIRLLAWEHPNTTGASATAPGGTSRPRPPAAAVPPPRVVAVGSLEVPCWACPEHEAWPVRFRTDLDLLAPLGTGTANAGLFFKDFAKPDGPRFGEATAAMERRVDGPPGTGKILPPADPLLLEAEPWCDQATMRFYPEFFALNGWNTQLPNLLVPLNLARSWVGRGASAADPERAMADFRRAIRLGRLLRQEDVTVIADLVGIACIRMGAQGIYDLATRRGDTVLALAASIVLGECAPQRLLTSARLTRTEIAPYVHWPSDRTPSLDLADARLDEMIRIARDDPDRRFRGEAILMLNFVQTMGTEAQRDRATAVLRELAGAGDPIVAATAVWSRDTRMSAEALAETLRASGKE